MAGMLMADATRRKHVVKDATQKRAHISMARCLLALSMLLVHAGTLSAQEVRETNLQVVQLAGRQIYLEIQDPIESTEPPVAEDILQLFREGEALGDVKVIAVTANRVVATFIDSPFALTRGEFLIGRWKPVGIKPVIVEEDGAERLEKRDTTIVVRDPVSIFDIEPERRTRSKTVDRFDVNGRVMISSNVANSITKWSRVLDDRDIRWSALPSASVSFRVRDRESNWTANIQARYSHRWQTDSRINNTGLLSIYNVYLSKELKTLPLNLQLGRFYNRYQNDSPYWDGLLVAYDLRPFRFGVMGGFNPSRSNEGIQFDEPKTGFFITHQTRGSTLRSYSQFNAAAEFPSQYAQRTVLTWEQRFDYKIFSLDGEYQLEKVDGLNPWQQTRLQVRADADLTSWMEIDIRYSTRSPLIVRTSTPFLLDPRTRFGVNANFSIAQIRLSTGFSSLNHDKRRSITYTSRIAYDDSPLWNLSWSAYGTYWDSEQGYSWNAGIASTKIVETGMISIGFSGYQSRFIRTEQFTGSLYLNGTKDFKNGFSLSGRLNGSYGELIIRNGLTFSVSKRF